MRYPYSGEVGVGALASYMWSVYDDRNSSSDETAQYKGKDNDDVEGYKQRVFQAMRHSAALFAGHDEYIAEFRNGLPNDVKTSVDLIEDFMYDSFVNVPLSRTKSPQIKNLSGGSGTGTSKTFTWVSPTYSSGNYKNLPTGFRISKYNSGWQQVAQVSNTTSSYYFSTFEYGKKYKVTAYNSSGESYKEYVLDYTLDAPSGISITNAGAPFGFPIIDWNDNTENYLDDYNVYRHKKRVSDGYLYPAVLLGSTSNSTYTDNSLFYGMPPTPYEYAYSVKAVDISNNESSGSGSTQYINVGGLQKVNPSERNIPTVFAINQNYPNPFNPSTQINFELPEKAKVSLTVYNVMGQEVATLVNTQMQAGFHDISFEASNLSSGVYIARLVAVGNTGEQFIKEIKMQLIK
jgi:hypothetical protein